MLRRAPTRDSHFVATVVDNIPDNAAADLILSPDVEVAPEAGQFVHVTPAALDTGSDPLLRRPFSISDWDEKSGQFRLLVSPVGRVSQFLREVRPGELIDVLGPLGTPFPLDVPGGATAILIAGGIGIAPLIFLARRLTQRGVQTEAFIGAATRDELFGRPALAGMDISPHLCTEDGSTGERGLVTGPVERYVQKLHESDEAVIFACGPEPMLSAVNRLASRYGIRAYGSFEAHMACGVGACMGCSVKRTGPAPGEQSYARVCRDGPVFDLKEVVSLD